MMHKKSCFESSLLGDNAQINIDTPLATRIKKTEIISWSGVKWLHLFPVTSAKAKTLDQTDTCQYPNIHPAKNTFSIFLQRHFIIFLFIKALSSSMRCKIYLQDCCDGLNESEYNCQQQDKGCNPEGIPLDFVPPVIPPLGECLWFGFIVRFNNDMKARIPIFVAVERSISWSHRQVASRWIEIRVPFQLFLIPLLTFRVSSRKKQRK